MYKFINYIFIISFIAFYSSIVYANNPGQDQALKTCADSNNSWMFNKPGFIIGNAEDQRVYLYSDSAAVGTSKSKKNAYLINGDLVFRQWSEDPNNESYLNPFPDSICVAYIKPHHRAVMGWIPRADFGDLEASFSQMGDQAKSAFSKLPPEKWTSHFEKELGVPGKPTESGLRWRTYDLDGDDQCYWTAYLLNDVVWVQAVTDSDCWGNHGASNPSGPYDWK